MLKHDYNLLMLIKKIAQLVTSRNYVKFHPLGL